MHYVLEIIVSVEGCVCVVEELLNDSQSTDSSSDSVMQYIYSFFPRPLEILSYKAFQ